MQLPIRHAGRPPLMFLIRHYILQGPFHPSFKCMFADLATFLCTDGAGEVHTGIGVDKEFHGLAKLLADESGQRIDLHMRLDEIEIPGQGKMTIHVQDVPILDHPEIVQVHPIIPPVGIEIRHHALQQLHIRLVHDAGDAAAQYPVACEDDDGGKEEGDDRVQDRQLGIPDDDKASDDTNSAIGVRLEMLAAGLQGHGAVLFPLVDADGANDEIDDGCDGYEIDTLVQFFECVGMNKIHYGLVDDDQPGHNDQRAFHSGGEKFRLAMPIRMVFIAWLGGYIEAIQSNKTSNDIDGAFQGIGEYGYGLCKIVCCQLHEEEDNGSDYYPLLQTDIFFSFSQTGMIIRLLPGLRGGAGSYSGWPWLCGNRILY